jgi:hypothetical protein
MRTTTKRRAGQLALVTVAAPIAAWALEQAARRADAGDKNSLTSRRLRQGADFVQRFGRGPLADRLRQRPVPTVTWRQPSPQPDQHRGQPTAAGPGSRLRLLPRPRAHSRAIRRTHAFVPGNVLALLTGLRDGRMVSQLR